MANIKSAEKRWRQSLKRRMRNRIAKSTIRTRVKSVNRTIGAGEPDAEALKLAIKALDKAAEKGIIHPNNAARRKSRLMHRFALSQSGQIAATTRTRGARAPRATRAARPKATT